jgi:hypothetical protein
MLFSDDPDAVRLKDLGLRVNERFNYDYDFTDGWKQMWAPLDHLGHTACCVTKVIDTQSLL